MQGEGVIKTLTLAADDPNYFSRESLYANWEESLAFLKIQVLVAKSLVRR